jgi:hypothetical protein
MIGDMDKMGDYLNQYNISNFGVATDAYISKQTFSSDCVDLSGFEK